jgi:hypothetical protein
MLLIALLFGVPAVIFIIIAIIGIKVYNYGMIFGGWLITGFFILCLLVFGAMVISYNSEVAYINKTYDKNYSLEEYFFNRSAIQSSIIQIKTFKGDLEIH